jgi:hypothetical protein
MKKQQTTFTDPVFPVKEDKVKGKEVRLFLLTEKQSNGER